MQIIEQCFGNGYDKVHGYAVPGLASVIVPAYNHAAYISQAIQSIVQQTYRPIEVLVLDDGSQDETYAIALETLQATDIPFLAIRKRNQGSCVTGINNGLSLSHGEFVSILASDDLYYPEKLQASIALLKESGAPLVLAKNISMYENGTLIPGTETNIEIVRKWHDEGRLLEGLYAKEDRIQFPYLGMMFRRDAFDILGYYDPGIFTEDYDMLFRIAASDIRIAFLSQVVGVHRRGDRSLQYMLRVSQDSERVLRKYAPSFWVANKALAYTQVQQAMISWRLDKKRSFSLLALGILRYPPVLLYLISVLGPVFRSRKWDTFRT